MHYIKKFKGTLDESHDLVLFFGREPNNHGNPVYEIGDYNLKTNSQFWRRSFTFLKRASCIDIKKIAIEKKSSPIIFSNVFPLGILNSVSGTEKAKNRQALTQNMIREHINKIFRDNQFIIKRVKVCIVSIDKKTAFPKEIQEKFDFAASEVCRQCKEYGILFNEVPYLNSNSIVDIDKKITKENIALMKNIAKDFANV